MTADAADILMITHRSPDRVALSLPALLESCRGIGRVWLWQNGDDAATIKVIEPYRTHPSLHRIHFSPVNVGIRPPTNWLWEESSGPLVGKVDDDCVVRNGWIETISSAHAAIDSLGAISCWHFQDQDYRLDVAARKILRFNDHRVMVNCWVGGSGYLLKRKCLERIGHLKANESFTTYCIRLARSGWINGWYFPFIKQLHLDDPQAPGSLMRSDDDLLQRMPLSAQRRGTMTLREWDEALRRTALELQRAPISPRYYAPWRVRLRQLRKRLRAVSASPGYRRGV